MELVVVNGANAISKGVLSKLAASGAYSKIKLVDPRPFRRSVYPFSASLGQVQVDRVQA